MRFDVDNDQSYDYDEDGNHNNTDEFFLPQNEDDTVYGDRNNTHDKNVRESVATSVGNLLDDDLYVTMSDIKGSDLSCSAIDLAIDYCKSKHEHNQVGIRYKTLLLHVWQRIINSEDREELTTILSTHLEEAEDLCFTGRFNHTLSVLAGFDDGVSIDISESAHIGGIIIATRDRLSCYDAQEHYDLAKEQLEEAGYDEDTIEPWLRAITES